MFLWVFKKDKVKTYHLYQKVYKYAYIKDYYPILRENYN